MVGLSHFGFPDYPDGQLRASARDLATFLAAVSQDGGGLLSPAMAATMLSGEYGRGLIWAARTWEGERGWWGHGGDEAGTKTDMQFRRGAGCEDADDGATDAGGYGCEGYERAWCGEYDDDDFEAHERCCVCGGGATIPCAVGDKCDLGVVILANGKTSGDFVEIKNRLLGL